MKVKRVVGGHLYNTEQAKLIAESRYDGASDEEDYKEALFRNDNGVLFLAAEGGVESFYSAILRGGKPARGTEIIPLTAAEACRWLEDHDHIKQIEQLFGAPPPVGHDTVPIDLRVSKTMMEKIELAAAKNQEPVGDWLRRLVEEELGGVDVP